MTNFYQHTMWKLHFLTKPLCSRNFQNVKLRFDFVEIWSFYRHSDFTWNQIFANSDGQKMSFWQFYRFWNLIFSKFEPFFKFQIYQNSKFWTVEKSRNLVRICHENITVCKCNYCKESFGQKESLKVHIRKMHGNQNFTWNQ